CRGADGRVNRFDAPARWASLRPPTASSGWPSAPSTEADRSCATNTGQLDASATVAGLDVAGPDVAGLDAGQVPGGRAALCDGQTSEDRMFIERYALASLPRYTSYPPANRFHEGVDQDVY